jgi:hypothetical protein
MLANTWSWKQAGGAFAGLAARPAKPPAAIPWEALEREPLPAEERERTRAAWVHRAHDEYRSMTAFTELLGELAAIAAPLDVLAAATRLVEDEVKHVALCARVVEALGGPGEQPGEPRWVRSDKRLPVQARVAMTCVGSLAIGETLSVAGITDALAKTTHPTLRAVTETILADEHFHSAFGFAWIESQWAGLPYSTRLMVENRLPALIAHLEAERPPSRRALFERTMREVIVPRLTALGVRS